MFKYERTRGEFDVALDPRLARQSLGRPLTELEAAFARDIEAVFAEGTHLFADVATALAKRGTQRPSGEGGAWTEESLARELEAVNAALDAAYAESGIGA
jgi:hypothetical protein